MIPGSSIRSFAPYLRGRIAVMGVLATLVLTGALSSAPGVWSDVIGPGGVALGIGAAAVLILRGAVRLDTRERQAWTLIGLGLTCAVLGVTAVALLTAFGVAVAAFGPLDVFFVLTYVLTFIGVAVMPHAAGSPRQRVVTLVDGLVAGIAFGTLAWIWFLEDQARLLADAPLFDRVMGLAYPMLDVALLVILSVLWIRRSAFRFDPRLVLLSLGLLFQIGADLSYVATAAGVTFGEAQPIYPLYMASVIFMVLVGVLLERRPARREFAPRPVRLISLAAPYGAAAVMIGVLVWEAVAEPLAQHRVLVAVSAVTASFLIFIRQWLTLRQYRERLEGDRRALVSSISHELRTPLTSVVGMLELLRSADSGLTDEERAEFLDTSADQSRYMTRIVSDLVMLARNEELEVRRSSRRLDEVIDSALASVGADLEVVTEVPAVTVVVDGDRIQQAVANLVSNAFKYGGGKVLLTAEAERDLVIEVHDDGEGVPTRYELIIWDRFERGSRRLDSRVPGSGIGLAVVAEVARAHGGDAGYRRSERLGGACFYLSVPLSGSAA